ncbi:MAG: baseplate J/gp47 family protein [Clostridia bacterium]|nr:baseplate J/gp47 family protein [Clostridia bacterium]
MKDTDEIFEEMALELEQRSGIKVNRGGDMALRLYVVASELVTLWAQADWLKNQGFPQTATGEFLDMHAQMRGLERTEAVCAEGNIRFVVNSATTDIAVAKGTVCMNAAGTEFLTTEQGLIPAGSTYCDVAAAAREGGSFGNVPAESVCYMSLAPVGVVRCYNPMAFSGGADEETDDNLRARIFASYASLPNGSNSAYYEQAALDTDGVAAVAVRPCERGLGTVDIIISGADGLPSQSLIDTLQDKLDEQREICVDIDVLSPTAVTVNISVQVEIADGFDKDDTLAAVEDAIGALFDGKLLGKNVLLAKLGSVIFAVEGVENYVITLPTADVAVSATQLPVAGTVTVTRR